MSDPTRPTSWDSYHGQTKLKQTLKIAIDGSLERGERLEHILLVGPPGSGKTSIASLIAEEACQDLHSVIPPIKPMVLRRIVNDWEGILFIDEIHRMSVKEQETLLPLLEDQKFQTDSGLCIENDFIVIIGATTERKKIIEPLWDRFTLKPPFDPYTDEEMAKIVLSMAKNLGVEMNETQATILGKATGGVPRNAKSFVKMAQNLNTDNAKAVLEQCRVTEDGLETTHLDYLRVLIDSGGQCGVDILSNHTDMPKEVIQSLEKLLLRKGYIEFSKGGRVACKPAYQALKRKVSL